MYRGRRVCNSITGIGEAEMCWVTAKYIFDARPTGLLAKQALNATFEYIGKCLSALSKTRVVKQPQRAQISTQRYAAEVSVSKGHWRARHSDASLESCLKRREARSARCSMRVRCASVSASRSSLSARARSSLARERRAQASSWSSLACASFDAASSSLLRAPADASCAEARALSSANSERLCVSRTPTRAPPNSTAEPTSTRVLPRVIRATQLVSLLPTL